MNKSLFIFLVSFQLLLSPALLSQRHHFVAEKKATGAGFTDDNGDWLFERYADDIIKTTFQPKGYTKNKLASNTVIRKPLRTQVRIDKPFGPHIILQLGKSVTIEYRENMSRYYVNNELMLILDEPVRKDSLNIFVLRIMQGEKISAEAERPMFFISSKGYGIFFDNPSQGYVDIGKTNPMLFEAGFTSGQLNFYLIPGNGSDEILRKYAALTRRQSAESFNPR